MTTMQRVAVIFDNTLRPETTGLYCRRALDGLARKGRITRVRHFLPSELDAIPSGNFDLFLFVDDGLTQSIPRSPMPSVWWAIDTHIDFERCLRIAQQADLTFCAQKSGAERLRAAGISGATWLPVACDPELHARHDVAKRYDWAFVGNMFPGERERLLGLLRETHPESFVGQCYFQEMAETYSAARCVFNRSVADDLNMRVFEGLCSGSLVVTNACSGLDELFEDGRHLVTYSDDGELLEKLTYYLEHDEDREAIAGVGLETVLAQHTYQRRMETVLAAAKSFSDGIAGTALKERDARTGNRCDHVVYVGGHDGANVERVRQAAPLAQIHVFEADPDLAAALRERFGEASRVDVHEAALLDRRGLGEFWRSGDPHGSSVYGTKRNLLTPERIEVLYVDVEEFLGGLSGSVALYLNCEGAEFPILSQLLSSPDRVWERIDKLCVHWHHQPHRLPEFAADYERLTETLRERRIDWNESFNDFLRSLNTSKSDEAPRRCAATPNPVGKDHWYFEFERPELLTLIPETAQRILDVGCGAGRLGAAIRERQGSEVTGIEFNSWAAEQAAERLDAVHTVNVESADADFDDGRFDCVICADVLEHLRDPLEVLRKIRRWLQPNGCLVTSIPNVRNHRVIKSLLAGNWTYESAGLLDSDHVRFFTRREIEKLLFRAGFRTDDLRIVPGEGFQDWVNSGRPREVTFGELQIRTTTEHDAQEYFAYQYLARSRPVVVPDHGLTSIIIVTHDQLAHTKACIDSIRLLTDEPIELIFVDNASTDRSPGFLRSIDDATLIVNDSNRGFPAGVNQGIEVARGANILLLNNDTVVTTGWLRRMLDVLHSDERIGLVGPVSNNISGEQQIRVSYGNLSELDGWAWDWGREHGHELVETDRLVGFCLLFKREVVDRVGLFDERFGIGCFEDDDFCRRANEAGFRSVIVRGAFVHHVGSATFRASGVDFGAVLRENRRRYDEKWNGDGHAGHEQESLRIERLPDQNSESGNGRSRQFSDVRLSVCLIVRDNADTIRPCLESIRPWVDEMVVVDTGSTDDTPRICEELGARVFHWTWQDDFAAARNVSFDHARGEWLFWMDSDDTIPEECGRALRELADGEHAVNVLGYVVQVHCPSQDASDVTVVDHVKLVRNRPDLRFEFRIHEQIIPAIRRAGGEVAWTDIHIVHSGADRTPEGRQRKLERDFRLLHLELAERPDHPFVLFNLGMTHADAGQHDEAVQYLERCVAVSQPRESHVRKAYALLVNALSQAGRRDDAWERCQQGLGQFPDDKELLFRQAMLQHQSGRLREAEQSYLRILDEQVDRHFTSVDAGITGHKARHNLAIVYEEMGRVAEAASEWRRIIQQEPMYEPARCGLARLST